MKSVLDVGPRKHHIDSFAFQWYFPSSLFSNGTIWGKKLAIVGKVIEAVSHPIFLKVKV